MKIRRASESFRATAQKVAVVAVPAEADVEQLRPGAYRRVTLILPFEDLDATPPQAAVYLSIDEPTNKDVALTRGYNMVGPMPGGFPIQFYILPNQKVYLMAETAMTTVGVIVEYLESEAS